MRVQMKKLLMKLRINDVKCGTAFLLVLFMAAAVQVMDLSQAVFADSINGNKDVSYSVDKVYDKDNKSLIITVDADEENSNVTIDRVILPDGRVVNGDMAVYTVDNNGNYKFSVEYTVDYITATSSVATPSESTAKRKKRDINVAVNEFQTVLAVGDVEINNETNFPDPKFQNYIIQSFDINKDGLLSLTERNAVTILVASSLGISDVSGLHFFPNLEVLRIERNNLTSLDVGSLPNLQTLDVKGYNLTSLDASQNPELKQLIISGGNLTSLDVSRNPNLQKLWVSDNKLTSLDVSQSPNL